MRRLTFQGYLTSYVNRLGGEDTLDLSRLVVVAQAEPRLFEPLLLWTAKSGRVDRLGRLLAGHDRLQRELQTLATLESSGNLDTALESGDPKLRAEYRKVWKSFVARRDAPKRDTELKLEARKRVLALESKKHVTRYRMAKDLGLNPGNLHAFLAQGNATKLSLERAYELVRYLEAA